MKGLTIEKLVPLLTSPDWRKRLVGEYYEVIARLGGVKHRLEALYCRLHTIPSTDIACTLSAQTEIDQMLEQLYSMKQYECILYRRIALLEIPYVDILSEALAAEDALTEPPEGKN